MTLRNQCTHRQCWFQFSAQKHLDFYSLRPAGSSHGPRCSFKRGAGPGYRRGRAGPQSSFSFLIHSKITHCKFPDCWERRRKGAEERGLLRAPSRGHPGPEWRPAGRAESGSQFWLRWPHQEASVSTPGNLRAPPAPPPAPGSGSPSPSPLPRAGPPPSWALRLGCLPGDGWPLSMAQYGHPSPLGMAAREELYSKVTPRRNRQQRPGTIKHGSALDVLLSMGFPRARA